MIGQAVEKGVAAAVDSVIGMVVSIKKSLSSFGSFTIPGINHQVTIGADIANALPVGQNPEMMQQKSWADILKESTNAVVVADNGLMSVTTSWGNAISKNTNQLSLNAYQIEANTVASKLKKEVVVTMGTMTSQGGTGLMPTNNADPIIAELAREFNAAQGNAALQAKLNQMIVDEEKHNANIALDQLSIIQSRNPSTINAQLNNLFAQTLNRVREAQDTTNSQLSHDQTNKLGGSLNDIGQASNYLGNLSLATKTLLQSADYNPALVAKALAELNKTGDQQIHDQTWAGFNAQQDQALKTAEHHALQGTILSLRSALSGYQAKVSAAANYDPNSDPGRSNVQIVNYLKNGFIGPMAVLFTAVKNAQDVVNKEKAKGGGSNKYVKQADTTNLANLISEYRTAAASRDKFLASITGSTAASNQWLRDTLGPTFMKALEQSNPKLAAMINNGDKPNPADLSAAGTLQDIHAQAAAAKQAMDEAAIKFHADVAAHASPATLTSDVAAYKKLFDNYFGGNQDKIYAQKIEDAVKAGNYTEVNQIQKAQNAFDQGLHTLSEKPVMVLGKSALTEALKTLGSDLKQHASAATLAADNYQVQVAGGFANQDQGTINSEIFNKYLPYWKSIEATAKATFQTDKDNGASQAQLAIDRKAVLDAINHQFMYLNESTSSGQAAAVARHNATMAMDRAQYSAAATADKQTFDTDVANAKDQITLFKDMDKVLNDMKKAHFSPPDIGKAQETMTKTIYKTSETNDRAGFANDIANGLSESKALVEIAKILADLKGEGVKGNAYTAAKNTLDKQYYSTVETSDRARLDTLMSNNSSQKDVYAQITKIYNDMIKEHIDPTVANNDRINEQNKFWTQQQATDQATLDNAISSNYSQLTVLKAINKVIDDMSKNTKFTAAEISKARTDRTTSYFKGVVKSDTDKFNSDVSSNVDQKTIFADMKAIMNAFKMTTKDGNAIAAEQLKLNKQYYGTKLTNDQNQFDTDLTNNATMQTLMTDLIKNVNDMKGEGKTGPEISNYLDKTQKAIDAQAKQNRTAYDFGNSQNTPAAVKSASFGSVDLSFGLAGQSSQMQIIRRLEEALQEAKQQNLHLEQIVSELSNQDQALGGIKNAVEAQTGVNKAGHEGTAAAIKGNKQIGNRREAQGPCKSVPY